MTRVHDWSKYRGAVDLVVAGTPCQDFSVAGKRAGMAGERSGLALEFVRILADVRPRWIIWENVPGVFSTNGGRDFGTFLRALDDIGYSCAWRVLDAQFFGVPQRRRRVFVVGHLGDWRPAAAVLFERESLRGDTPARVPAREDIANTLTRSAGRHGWSDSGNTYIPHIVGQAMSCKWCKGTSGPAGDEHHNLIAPGKHVRRLTPRECERLQGFPDDYTAVEYRGKPAADGPRYKALGNSMAVPVMHWIGERISRQMAKSPHSAPGVRAGSGEVW